MSKSDTKKRGADGLLGGIVFGLAFGFLLQKGGVGKYNVLIGQLLLEDYTVIKIMMSAVAVGSVGVFFMHRMGLVKLHIKDTIIGAQSIGGLLFGAGFALAAYCPGTGAAAIGQGSWDALLVALGLILGSYLYALLSGRMEKTVKTWGDKGEQTLFGALNQPALPVAVITAAAICGVLFLIETYLP
ncbi:MAG: YeeE/YedE thiosulfate transporter family protein [Luteolibacter sp.]